MVGERCAKGGGGGSWLLQSPHVCTCNIATFWPSSASMIDDSRKHTEFLMLRVAASREIPRHTFACWNATRSGSQSIASNYLALDKRWILSFILNEHSDNAEHPAGEEAKNAMQALTL